MCPGRGRANHKSALTALLHACGQILQSKQEQEIDRQKTIMSSCRVPRSTLFLSISLALLALQPPVSQAQLQLANVNISRAVEILAERFRQLANDGLGVDALKVSVLNGHLTLRNPRAYLYCRTVHTCKFCDR